MNGLALQVQEALGRDPHAGDLYVFRGASGRLVKVLWHDGLGMSLYAKRVHLAVSRRWRGGDLVVAAGLYAGGDRLAEPTLQLAAAERRVTAKKLHQGVD